MSDWATWVPRGDNFHWDHHADGCFIEKDGNRFVLYNGHCGVMSSARTLEGAMEKHQEACAAEAGRVWRR